MVGELIIRPALNDHEIVADLLAPGGTAIVVGRHRPLISRLVVDAHVIVKRPQFAEAAATAGIPLVVDPLTPFFQGQLREDDPWAKLSFGSAPECSPTDFASGSDVVAQVISFELANGATAVVPPYPYASGPDDPWFEVGLRWLRETRAQMDSERIGLPLLAVFCGQLLKFGSERSWTQGLDRFAAEARAAGANAIGLCLSPAGNGKESYHKVLRLFRAAEHVKGVAEMPVFAWRQGIYGPALIASGLDGYETGIGIGEQANVRSNIASRRPPKPGREPGRGGSAGIYLEPLGRSVTRRVAQLLLANVAMRAKLMCTDERCCPHGVASTLDHHREHAVRSRARELATLEALPARSWRLNHIATKAHGAVTLAHQTNRLLKDVGEDFRIGAVGIEALARVADELRRADSEGRSVA
jgi:hypothetical protein